MSKTMMLPISRHRLRRIRRLVILFPTVIISWLLVLYITGILRRDNVAVLFVRLLGYKAHKAFPDEGAFSWISQPPLYPVDLGKDVGIVVKTGYGTQNRLPGFRKAWEFKEFDPNVLVIADFTKKDEYGRILIHDMIKPVMESHALRPYSTHKKVKDYKNMTQAIQGKDEEYAKAVAKEVGWPLDSMKFISGLKLAYETLPTMKWYMLVDDDTFILKPHLELLLGHLNPRKPYYLGNQVGGWNGRFAHGGSSIILSHEAMRRLFEQNPRYVEESYVESLDQEIGDKLLAFTFMKADVHFEYRYSDFFNGQVPLKTKITPERFCMPILGFHWLQEEEQMMDVLKTFKDTKALGVIRFHELWTMYGQPSYDLLALNPITQDREWVDWYDEITLTEKRVKSAEDCRRFCLKHSEKCLAWSWYPDAKECNYAPQYFVGNATEAEEAGTWTGLNMPRIARLLKECQEMY